MSYRLDEVQEVFHDMYKKRDQILQKYGNNKSSYLPHVTEILHVEKYTNNSKRFIVNVKLHDGVCLPHQAHVIMADNPNDQENINETILIEMDHMLSERKKKKYKDSLNFHSIHSTVSDMNKKRDFAMDQINEIHGGIQKIYNDHYQLRQKVKSDFGPHVYPLMSVPMFPYDPVKHQVYDFGIRDENSILVYFEEDTTPPITIFNTVEEQQKHYEDLDAEMRVDAQIQVDLNEKFNKEMQSGTKIDELPARE